MSPDHNRARRCAEAYRKLGLCPLPSRMDDKRPMLSEFKQFYDGEQIPEEVYQTWQTTNIQLITGTCSGSPMKIIVIDCDGPEAISEWEKLCETNQYQPRGHWRSSTGSGGLHLYFTAPPNVVSCGSGLLWGLWDVWGGKNRIGSWVPHKEIRILGDRSLVVAPPSIHVTTGVRYRFHESLNPLKISRPAPAPSWLLDLPRIQAPRMTQVETPAPRPSESRCHPGSRQYRHGDVIEAMRGRLLDQARQWGLRTLSNSPNRAGWVPCYVPGREHPGISNSASGSFYVPRGYLKDMTTGEVFTFFDIAVRLGVFMRWQDACNDCGQKYLAKS